MSPKHVRPINPPPPRQPIPTWWYGAGTGAVIVILIVLGGSGGNRSALPVRQIPTTQTPFGPSERGSSAVRVTAEAKREAEDAVKASQKAAKEGRFQAAEEKTQQANRLDPDSAAKQVERERTEAFDKALAVERSGIPPQAPRSIPAGRRIVVAPVENTSSMHVSVEAVRSSIERFVEKVPGVAVISRQEFERIQAGGLLGADGVVVRATIASVHSRTPPPDFGDGTKLAVTEATVRLELISAHGNAIASHESSGKSTAFGSEGKDSADERQKAIDDAVKRAFDDASFTAYFTSKLQ